MSGKALNKGLNKHKRMCTVPLVHLVYSTACPGMCTRSLTEAGRAWALKRSRMSVCAAQNCERWGRIIAINFSSHMAIVSNKIMGRYPFAFVWSRPGLAKQHVRPSFKAGGIYSNSIHALNKRHILAYTKPRARHANFHMRQPIWSGPGAVKL